MMPPSHPLAAVTLTGRHVRLVPLGEEHLPALCAVGLDPELWRLTVSRVASEADMGRYVAEALAARDRGTALPFVTTLADDGRVVGSTRLANYAPTHRRVEIGWTWIARPWQRSAVNTEAKLLMLAHAFDTLGCERVELKTDALNERSRAAILRLGATEEGTLRRHTVTEGGRVRDTVYFSILADEWPAVRERLQARLMAGLASSLSAPSRGLILPA
ncbi:MAG TPA: GNAT family protein [Gemmatimonadaceae bacterium]|nr:GNAT family protein [Gemmatimonadaceae bacterium]